ncbi:MAG: hypothetical protein AcusKO_22640 [Acuticoccus sp.]
MSLSETPAPAADTALPYHVPTSTRTLNIVAWTALVLGALSFLMLVSGDVESGEDMLAAVGGTVFFGGLGGWLKFKLKSFRTAFEATEEGVTLHDQYGKKGPIGWHEIRDFRIVKTKVAGFLTLKAIGVELEDPDRTLSRMNVVTRLSGKASEFMDTTPLGVPTMVIAAPTYAVLDRLNATLARKRAETAA